MGPSPSEFFIFCSVFFWSSLKSFFCVAFEFNHEKWANQFPELFIWIRFYTTRSFIRAKSTINRFWSLLFHWQNWTVSTNAVEEWIIFFDFWKNELCEHIKRYKQPKLFSNFHFDQHIHIHISKFYWNYLSLESFGFIVRIFPFFLNNNYSKSNHLNNLFFTIRFHWIEKFVSKFLLNRGGSFHVLNL